MLNSNIPRSHIALDQFLNMWLTAKLTDPRCLGISSAIFAVICFAEVAHQVENIWQELHCS